MLHNEHLQSVVQKPPDNEDFQLTLLNLLNDHEMNDEKK